MVAFASPAPKQERRGEVDVVASDDLEAAIQVRPSNIDIPMSLWKAADEGDEASRQAVATLAVRENLSFVSAAQSNGIEITALVKSGSIGLA